MDTEKLHNIQVLKSEIGSLEKIKNSLYYDLHSPAMNNESHSSTPGNPTEQAVKQIAKYEEMIIKKKSELQSLTVEVISWSWTINDLDVRAIVNWHYLKGLTWKQTSNKMTGYPNSDTCRKKFFRYMDENQ